MILIRTLALLFFHRLAKFDSETLLNIRMTHHSVIIIGAGIAGLTCAKYLQSKGIQSTILEASDGIGGRVRTDVVEGFRLDRGFQVLLTAYPEAQKLLNYETLSLKPFQSGSVIRVGNSFTTLADPFKQPNKIAASLFSPVGSLTDKLRVLRLVMHTTDLDDDIIFRLADSDTMSFLKDFGWSSSMIHNFFQPFFGGVFLEKDSLDTSSNFFEFIFKKFYEGDAVLPAEGIQAIPEQISATLPKECIQLNTKVLRIEDNQVFLESGESLSADNIVIATDARNANALLGQVSERKFNRTTCTYFAADHSPLLAKMIVLNPNRESPVHNVCVPSDIAPAYAPEGKALVSVSTQGLENFDETQLVLNIRRELTKWYGQQVQHWRHLRTYHIPEALPQFNKQTEMAWLQLGENLYQCGDQTAYPSLNAAMKTGREVAEMIAF